jgi:potassium efflux system protein
VQSSDFAPVQTLAFRKQLQQLEIKTEPKLAKSLSDNDLPALQQLLQAELTKLRTDLAELETLLTSQTQRTQLARERLNAATHRQLEIAENLQLASTAGELPRLVEAQRWALEFETKALGSEIEMLNQELLSQSMRIQLIATQRDLATLGVNRKLDYVELLNSLVSDRRLSVAETVKEKTDETERLTFGKHSLVQQIARRNTQLGDELNQLATELLAIFNNQNKAFTQAKRVADNYRLARKNLILQA